MFYVISYDVPDDRRRTRVHSLLKNFGTRVQYSVFECELDTSRREELRGRLEKLLAPEVDSIRCYRLCKDCLEQTEVFGTRPLTTEPDYWIV
ncbi:MAG TPA: CRISPR-associated endonuclease Cas2 [Terriglobia bacterium]|nr:CRISPR-associated endonuclease Cas2 [Terriglobia bacterium]